MQRRAHRLPPGRLLGQAADLHLAPLRQQQRARDRRRGHHQHVGEFALAAQQQPLIHAEPVLLVDHRQRQVVVLHALLEQRVGADDQRHRAIRQSAQQLRPRAPLHATGQQRHRRRRQARQRAVVLLRQHLGRRHQRGLLPGLDRAQHRQQRHQRLAGADVALQQPQHPPVGRQIGVDLSQRLLLRAGERMAEARQRLGAQRAVAGQAAARPQRAAGRG